MKSFHEPNWTGTSPFGLKVFTTQGEEVFNISVAVTVARIQSKTVCHQLAVSLLCMICFQVPVTLIHSYCVIDIAL